jgi:hypothetical protein
VRTGLQLPQYDEFGLVSSPQEGKIRHPSYPAATRLLLPRSRDKSKKLEAIMKLQLGAKKISMKIKTEAKRQDKRRLKRQDKRQTKRLAKSQAK